jgi:hypothetical protein
MRAPKLLLLSGIVLVPLLSLSLRAAADPAAAVSAPAASAPASATSPAPGGSPAGSGASAASASSSAAPKPPQDPTLTERLVAEPLPDKPSRMPTMKEWKDARPLHLEPGQSSGCSAHLIREWVHLHCGLGSDVDVSLLAGDPKDVALNLVGEEFSSDGDAVLPLRRGRSYVVSMTSLQMGRYSSGLPETAALLWVSWPEDSELPRMRLE